MAPNLSEDELDDLIYCARVGELSEFCGDIEGLCTREKCSLVDILESAVDAESGNGALHMAAANGHSEIISHVISTIGAEKPELIALLNKRNAAGNTALHWAALNGHMEAVKALVDGGADPYIQNGVGHDAIYEAEVNDKKEAVDWMLKEGDLEGYDDAEGEGEAEAGEGMGKEITEESLKEQLAGLTMGKGKEKDNA